VSLTTAFTRADFDNPAIRAKYELENAPLSAELGELSLAQLDALAREYSPKSLESIPSYTSHRSLGEDSDEDWTPDVDPTNEKKGSPYINCIDRQTDLYSTGVTCELQAVFRIFDHDKSGLMDMLEFQLVLRNVVEGADIRTSEKAMAYRDLDSNGVIDMDEFKQWWYQAAIKNKNNPGCEDCCGSKLCAQKEA